MTPAEIPTETPKGAVADDAPAPPVAPTMPTGPTTDTPLATTSMHTRLLGVIVALLIVYTCAVAEAIVVPIVIAILLGLMLAPFVRLLERWHVARAVGSLFAVVMLLALLVATLFALATPVQQWMARIPHALARMQSAMRELRRPFQAASDASRELEKLTDIAGERSLQVVDASPDLLTQLAGSAPLLLASIVITIFLTFLFLLHGDAMLRKFVTLAPHLRAKRDLVTATRQAQRELSVYMITVTLINAGLGLATALALHLLGMPDPLLWGGVATVLNFAPFLGPLLTAIALAVAGFAEFDSPFAALAAPGVFLCLHLIEGQVVTPHLVGRRLALDPMMVFLALIVLGWIWGATGLLIAVPLLSCAKIIAERMPEGSALAILLSE